VDERILDEILPALGLRLRAVKQECWEPTRIREGATKAGLVMDWMLEQGLKPTQVVVDLTGGSKPMSVAAFIAAEQRKLECEYVASDWDQGRARPVRGTQRPILITRYGQG